ncbi:AAA family ATPase [Aliarcobacter butzleri]|uniref:AAA family ATPase n=1 Tax=Aliarcobacter butzleri TaxID=28197 RepID=UPI00263E101A|nr:AAA family ATPase [Aliarcobacter butzleri]MDN5066637.1 AAA family ATPase [Aliarcobacter butzleri]
MNLFASLYNCIKKYSYSLEHINIIVDEIEAYLHPNWQKQFIDLIIKFFNLKGIKYNSKTNIILTSHSPFILSDLPKENVIFLKNGKQEYPFKNNEQTFGANIHTLLSHAFFMEYGLLGEFAKNKIKEIKKFYDFIQKFKSKINAKEKIKKRVKKYYLNKKERFNHIQSIIGEPFLQTIMKNYLDELEILFNGKKEFLDKEIKRLEELRKELK